MTGYLHINGEIGDLNSGNEFTTFQNLVAQYQNEKSKGVITDLVVKINSPGGSLKQGQDMYDFLENLKKEGISVTTIGENIVGSSATQPFLAGEVRMLAPGCDFFVHNPQGAPPKGDASFLAGYAQEVKKVEGQMLDFYVKQTGGEKSSIKAFMENETSLTTEEAISLGFATGVYEKETPEVVAFYDIGLEKKQSKQNNTIMGELGKKFDNLSKKFDKLITALTPSTDKRLTAWQEIDENTTAYIDFTPEDKNLGSFISVNVEAGESPVGGQAVIVDAEGNFNPAPAGEYPLEGGAMLVVGENAEVTDYTEGKVEEDEEMEALKKQVAEATAKIEALTKENKELKEGQETLAKETKTAIEESKEIVEEAEKQLEGIEAIRTEFKIPKDRLMGKREPARETAADRITAIQNGIAEGKGKSIKQQLNIG